MSLLIGSSSSSCESGSPDHKKQRIEEEERFDFKDGDMCGVVFGCGDSRVKVGLMNLRSDEQIQPLQIYTVAAPKNVNTDFSVDWGFIVVESKLYATGGQVNYIGEFHPWGDPYFHFTREVYFCDLRDAFTDNNSERCLEFKVVATLNSPKRYPLVVPYKDKIFFIAKPTRSNYYTPCEILHRSDGDQFKVEPLTTPRFWKYDSYLSRWRGTELDAHVVIRNKLYVRVCSPKRDDQLTLHCLDMDAQDWEEAEEEEEDCAVPHILKEVYQHPDRLPFNFVHVDKLFSLKLDGEDPSVPFLSVEIFNGVGKFVVDLKGVVDSMGLEGCCYVMNGWVIPWEEKTSDVFYLMLYLKNMAGGSKYMTYFCFCKFKLAENGSFEVSTRRVVCGPFLEDNKRLMISFTPANTKVLHLGDYESKLYDRDRMLLVAKALKEKGEATRMEEEEEEVQNSAY